eukprot:CAMPEP_0197467476 /NCGR_PEP_ID=MMETSP1175-20131217/65584_1 /TAXON_ID=1003142 /ORGANISM="Triceratium dubium, Strain CCMP147" /LENGTH=707 /DNA_ID=CAMNT_0043003545 /DNA_START=127 /DNA_END=2250 /DNA_ORIENTATION=+
MSCRTFDAAVYAAFLVLAILAAHYEYSHHNRSSAAESDAAQASALLASSRDINATAAALANASAFDAEKGAEWISQAEQLRASGKVDEEMAANATATAEWLRGQAEKERSEAADHTAAAGDCEDMYEKNTKQATLEAELERKVEEELQQKGCNGRFVFFRRRKECDALRQKARAEKEAALAELRAASIELEDERKEKEKAAALNAQAEADVSEANEDDAGAAEDRDRAAEEEEEAAKDEDIASGLFNRSRAEGDEASKKAHEAAHDAQTALRFAHSAESHRHVAIRNRRVAIALAAMVLAVFLIRFVVLIVNPVRSAVDFFSAVVGHVRKNKPTSSLTERAVVVCRAVWSASWKNVSFLAVHCFALVLAIALLSDQWLALDETMGKDSSLSVLSRGSMAVLCWPCLATAAKTAAIAALVHLVGLDPLPRLCEAHRVLDNGALDTVTHGTRQAEQTLDTATNVTRKAELRAAAEVLLVDSAFLFLLFAMETLILWILFGMALFGSKLLSATGVAWIYVTIFVSLAALRLHHLGFGRRDTHLTYARAVDADDGASFLPSESELFLGMVDDVLEGADFDRNIATGKLLRVFEEIDSASKEPSSAVETDSLLGKVLVGKKLPPQASADRPSYDAREDGESGSDGFMDVIGLSSGKVSVVSSMDGDRAGRDRQRNENYLSWKTLAVRRADSLECPFTVLVISCSASTILQLS